MDMKTLIEAWYQDKPDQAAVFAALLSKKYGTRDPDEMLSRFKADQADKYLKLKTGLEGRYEATQADVEREAGKAAIEKKKSARDNGEVERLKSELDALKLQEKQRKREAFRLKISRALNRANAPTSVYMDRGFLNAVALAMEEQGLADRDDLAAAVYNLAVDMDNKTVPSRTALELAAEAVANR